MSAPLAAVVTEGVNIIGDIAAALEKLGAGKLSLGAFREQVARDFAEFQNKVAGLEDAVAAVYAEGDRLAGALPEVRPISAEPAPGARG